jgi:hypothetical protein
MLLRAGNDDGGDINVSNLGGNIFQAGGARPGDFGRRCAAPAVPWMARSGRNRNAPVARIGPWLTAMTYT